MRKGALLGVSTVYPWSYFFGMSQRREGQFVLSSRTKLPLFQLGTADTLGGEISPHSNKGVSDLHKTFKDLSKYLALFH